MDRTADVVVIGGGVMGGSIAYQLAKKGIKTVVVEKAGIGAGSSGACDEAVLLQSKNPGLPLQLGMLSAAMYRDLPAELDYDIEYEMNGGMIVVETEEQMGIIRKFVDRQLQYGLKVSILSTAEARRIQPALSPHVNGATWSDTDARVNPIQLCFGYALAAARLGAEILNYTEVTGVMMSDGKVSGVETTAGRIAAGAVVNACGVFAPSIGLMVGLKIPIKPRRGQLLVTEPVAPLIHGDVLCARYIAAKHSPASLGDPNSPYNKLGIGLSMGQSRSGTIMIGATREFVGFDRSTTHHAMSLVADNATRLFPPLGKINLIRGFAGLRPYTPDGLPILGKVEGLDGFIMAAGHEGDGIALSPITGRLISELLDSGKSSVSLDPFSLHRFPDTERQS